MRAAASAMTCVAMFAAVTAVGACGQVIGEDFGNLSLVEDGSVGRAAASGSSGSSSGGSSNGGSAGSATGGAGGAVTGGAGGTLGVSGTSGSGGASGSGVGGSLGSAGTLATGGSLGSAGATTGGSAGTTGGSAGTDGGAPVPVPVVMNEMEGQVGTDFVELYNAGSSTFDLSGYKVADSYGGTGPPKTPEALVFPSGTTIAPGAFIVVEGNHLDYGGPFTSCSNNYSPCYHATWGISSSGERMYFLRPDDSEIEHEDYPDSTSAAGLKDGQSTGRVPDGASTWVVCNPTPGHPNQAI